MKKGCSFTMGGNIKRILIVDDEEVTLFGYKQVLSEPWLVVDTAETADAAKLLLEAGRYSAVILDLRLSNSTALEGLDLIPLVKIAQKDCRIIVITAYGDEAIKRATMESGADLFLEKPVDPENIKEMLADLGIRQNG
jgi:DNA-binding NtrC family response regulator